MKMSTKQNTCNISRIEWHVKEVDCGNTIVAADSREQNTTSGDYSPGGVMKIALSKCCLLINDKEITKKDQEIELPFRCSTNRKELSQHASIEYQVYQEMEFLAPQHSGI